MPKKEEVNYHLAAPIGNVPYLPPEKVREDARLAISALRRRGASDLIDILGLEEEDVDATQAGSPVAAVSA